MVTWSKSVIKLIARTADTNTNKHDKINIGEVTNLPAR